jgi:hypothetical protein
VRLRRGGDQGRRPPYRLCRPERWCRTRAPPPSAATHRRVLTLVSSADSPSSPLRYAPALAADWNAGVASATLMHRLHGSPARFPAELHLILDSQVTMALLIRVSFCTTSPWTSPSSWLLYLCV